MPGEACDAPPGARPPPPSVGGTVDPGYGSGRLPQARQVPSAGGAVPRPDEPPLAPQSHEGDVGINTGGAGAVQSTTSRWARDGSCVLCGHLRGSRHDIFCVLCAHVRADFADSDLERERRDRAAEDALDADEEVTSVESAVEHGAAPSAAASASEFVGLRAAAVEFVPNSAQLGPSSIPPSGRYLRIAGVLRAIPTLDPGEIRAIAQCCAEALESQAESGSRRQ